MALLPRKRIPLLAKLITSLKLVCLVIDAAAPKVRPYVPDENKTAFDNALVAIKGGCDVVRSIEYADTWAGTNQPWGSA